MKMIFTNKVTMLNFCIIIDISANMEIIRKSNAGEHNFIGFIAILYYNATNYLSNLLNIYRFIRVFAYAGINLRVP